MPYINRKFSVYNRQKMVQGISLASWQLLGRSLMRKIVLIHQTYLWFSLGKTGVIKAGDGSQLGIPLLSLIPFVGRIFFKFFLYKLRVTIHSQWPGSRNTKIRNNLHYFCNDSFINQQLAKTTDSKMLSKQEAPLREGGKEATSNMRQMWT